MIFSDDWHFYVMNESNRQNFKKWSTTKPEFQVSTPLHSAKVTVWCGLTATKIIGSFFYVDPEMVVALTIASKMNKIQISGSIKTVPQRTLH